MKQRALTVCELWLKDNSTVGFSKTIAGILKSFYGENGAGMLMIIARHTITCRSKVHLKTMETVPIVT